MTTETGPGVRVPGTIFLKGFRVVKFRRSKRGDQTIVFMPDLIHNGLHLQTHPSEFHLKTPSPSKTTIIESGSAGLVQFATAFLPILKALNRPPTPGFKMTGQIFPSTTGRVFELDNESARIDIEEMAKRAWNFVLDNSADFVETFSALRKQGTLGTGDYFFARIRRIGESCQGVLVDRSMFPELDQTDAWPADLREVTRQLVEAGIYFLTLGKEGTELLRRVRDFNPRLSNHLLVEIGKEFRAVRRGPNAGRAASELARIRFEHGKAAGRRPKRRISPEGSELIE